VGCQVMEEVGGCAGGAAAAAGLVAGGGEECVEEKLEREVK
jgi:hypothetical protein